MPQLSKVLVRRRENRKRGALWYAVVELVGARVAS